jgi:hypothetical protein
LADSIEITGPGASVTIGVAGYENPVAVNPSDANWLSCTVLLQIGAFSGSLAASFTTHDFARLFGQFQAALSTLEGDVSFLTDEDMLRLNLKFEKTGLVQISGMAQEFGQGKAALTFSFETDQSFLTQTCRQLEKVTKKFPVKEL